MRYGWIAGATLVAAVTLNAAAALADPGADHCGGSKEKAAGRYARSLLNCNARATSRNESVDPLCTGKAAEKLESAFGKAEAPGHCVTTTDAAGTETSVGSDVDAVVAALAPNPTDEARACAASKMKAAGKHYGTLLSCYAKGSSMSRGPTDTCLTQATVKLGSNFLKAESRDGCTALGDDGTVGDLDTTAVEARVRDLSPVCGDDITGPTQTCEPGDDAACPGFCAVTCACVFPPDCGNGVAEFPEECDDSNMANGDGCSSTCTLENASALCAGVPTTAGTAIDAVLVSTAFSQPIYVTAAPLDPARLFVVEREGTIRILNLADNTVAPGPFLDITGLTTTDGERGLLSMAFDPNYDSNRRFFLYYTNNSGNITIARYETSVGDPNIADGSSGKVLVVIPHPGQSNHNGGLVAFGPDGYLYAGTGDGGGGDDPDENGQDDTAMLGKILRIDVNVATTPFYAVPLTNPHYVDGTSDLELIWAKGVRNPWRFSFDRSTGDLLIGDVGQGAREEIDFQGVASTGGENYGWDIFEGDLCHEPDPAPMCPVPPTGFTFPILQYDHSAGCSITGGFVYRGCAMPDLADNYFYSDYCSNFVRTVEISGGTAINPQDRTADAVSGGVSFSHVISFGEDARGELYILDGDGSIYRIEPQ